MKKFTAMTLVYGLFRYVGMLWALRTILTDAYMVIEVIMMLLLQGMMAIRVYVLLGKSKRVRAALFIGFFTTQVINLSVVVSVLARGGSLKANISVFGVDTCYKPLSESPWVFPLCCSALLVFELTLIVLCLYHAITNLKRPLCTSIMCYAGSIASLIVRQSLIYFILAFVSVLVTAVSQAPSLRLVGLTRSLLAAYYLDLNY
ncbi:hypothetical protein CONPUDRAFT_93381 [Coniophora puteana RWD-64-598 SS2]|uniref:Uncharacterized protein n=1 Tax=Coniophora puteana (strain RWD-64-598) TaxID=741705 RepID=A0A5M3M8V7_CONPW|nr:uncharacterized protein CONPUDRAFT_93381 [Coniophora puteana RWD-64-598 SS2]EIW75638.1 hypothetical protein CONPUDRAFT_93381 [Coniophora puteana RWD-64-598 SS2]